jgi:hypothetical protein
LQDVAATTAARATATRTTRAESDIPRMIY